MRTRLRPHDASSSSRFCVSRSLALTRRRSNRSLAPFRAHPRSCGHPLTSAAAQLRRGALMIAACRPAKILLIDTNVYFSRRLSDALKREGFEVTCSTQPAFALTTLEYDSPAAIVCSTNMREMGALDIARMV